MPSFLRTTTTMLLVTLISSPLRMAAAILR
jgi:hypothetical protein